MPHFVIEYSSEVADTCDIDQVMQAAFDTGVASGLMQAADIKVRARAYDHHMMAAGPQSFLHVTVLLLDGRTDEQKEALALALRQMLQERLPQVHSVSIDIRDMNRVAYKKRVLGGGNART